MAPMDILAPAIALLAFIGYVWLLSRRFWIAVILTLILCYLLSATSPQDSAQIIYWAAGSAVFATALIAMAILPKPTPYVIEVRKKPLPKIKPEKDIVIDGTNVIFWGDHASLATLRSVVDHLRGKAMMPYVFLDASSKHLVRDALLDEIGFAKALGLKKERVMVCPDRSDADAFILGFAKEQNLAVVSNDLFEDRTDEVQGLRIVKGLLADGYPVLEGV